MEKEETLRLKNFNSFLVILKILYSRTLVSTDMEMLLSGFNDMMNFILNNYLIEC